MTVKGIIFVSMISGLCFVACTNESKSNIETTKDTTTNTKPIKMNSYISMFEIPAIDLSRAINFYEVLLDIKIEKMAVENMEMGIFPYEDQLVTGVIIKADGYQPSADGVTIYLTGENLQEMLERVESHGGEIIAPKTAHADESGYFAIFLDSEGNKVALNSPN